MNASHTTYASAGAGAAGAVTLSWLAKVLFHVDMPSEVAVELATLIAMASGYFLHQVVDKGAVVK